MKKLILIVALISLMGDMAWAWEDHMPNTQGGIVYWPEYQPKASSPNNCAEGCHGCMKKQGSDNGAIVHPLDKGAIFGNVTSTIWYRIKDTWY